MRAAGAAICVAIPLLVAFLPLGIESRTQMALAITSFMILAWMTNVMEYAVAGLIGCLLYWVTETVPAATAFAGFANTTTWFVLAAILIGHISNKSTLPQRVGSFIVSRSGASYSRILLGLIIFDFLLTILVPTGTGRVVIMASIAVGLIKLFDAPAGSNLARGMFLAVTYAATVFDKVIIAGVAAVTARGAIVTVGQVEVSWAVWLLAFLPASILTILVLWWFTLWLFPPEVASLEGKQAVIRDHFRVDAKWTPESRKAAALLLIGVGVWSTDIFHHIDPAIVAMVVALVALLPYVGVLSTEDLRGANMLTVLFVGAALSMSAVLSASGALTLLTNTVFAGLEPLLANQFVAIPVLYWAAFLYHFFLASEISMLASSMPILMGEAKAHGLNPLWLGMVWTFASGGKLFVYQSSVLVLGYSYGYFRHNDVLKIGALITVAQFAILALIAAFWWPLLGITP